MRERQPDLFGEDDAAEQRAQGWNQPQTCPRCGTHEPTGYLLRNNHGIDPSTDTIGGYARGEHPNYDEMCVAQDLVSNHISWAVQTGNDDTLIRVCERGCQLGLDVVGIMLQAQKEATK